MNDLASSALGRVITAYGPAICHTPRSAEMFIRQECGPYPDESKALIEALRQGVPEELLKYQPANSPWDSFSAKLQSRLRSSSGIGESEGAWAVDAWARVLGRHPETFVAAPEVKPVEMNQLRPATERQLKVAMTTVVGVGGMLGGGLGAVMVPAALLLTVASATIPLMSQPVRSTSSNEIWIAVTLVLLLIAAVGGLAGGLGAALGWLHGKGDRGHWAAFSTAFGGGFFAAALGSYFAGLIGCLVGAFIGAFGAATTTARRGGLA